MDRQDLTDLRSADENSLSVCLRRDNAFLLHRVAQLQGEVWDLSGRLAHALQPLDGAAAMASDQNSDRR